jgi:hypothetical protein
MTKIKDKIYVFDNIISKEKQKNIETLLLSNQFSWYYVNDITTIDNKYQRRPGFCHTFYLNEKENSPHSNLVKEIVENSCKKIKFKFQTIIQARTFLQVPLNIDNLAPDVPHIDLKEKHLVVLYYVLDNEADTILYKQKWNQKTLDLPKKLQVYKKIKPKQGTVLIFDGHYWHTAYQPTKSERCIINCNIK